jgi:hypothetical protein
MLLSKALSALFSLALVTSVEAIRRKPRPWKRADGDTIPTSWVEVPVHFSFFIFNLKPVQLPIDHFGDYNGTYNNRYWYNAAYYKAGGPVFRKLK